MGVPEKEWKASVKRVVVCMSVKGEAKFTGLGTCIHMRCRTAKIEGCFLTVNGLDALEGSPIMDVKRYFARVDIIPYANALKWISRGSST